MLDCSESSTGLYYLNLYYLIKLLKIPLFCCWWNFLWFGCSEFSTGLLFELHFLQPLSVCNHDSLILIFSSVDNVMFLNILTVFQLVFVVRDFSQFSLSIFIPAEISDDCRSSSQFSRFVQTSHFAHLGFKGKCDLFSTCIQQEANGLWMSQCYCDKLFRND